MCYILKCNVQTPLQNMLWNKIEDEQKKRLKLSLLNFTSLPSYCQICSCQNRRSNSYTTEVSVSQAIPKNIPLTVYYFRHTLQNIALFSQCYYSIVIVMVVMISQLRAYGAQPYAELLKYNGSTWSLVCLLCCDIARIYCGCTYVMLQAVWFD